MRFTHWTWSLTLLCMACASQETLEPAQTSNEELERIEGLELDNASVPEPGLLCSGQLTEDQFDALVLEGYRSFINLRVPTEVGTGWEQKHAGILGVAYFNLPIANPNEISMENARKFARLLSMTRAPVVVYCGSSNRVGALYGAKVFFVDGKDGKEALARARSAGMTGLESRLRQLLGL